MNIWIYFSSFNVYIENDSLTLNTYIIFIIRIIYINLYYFNKAKWKFKIQLLRFILNSFILIFELLKSSCRQTTSKYGVGKVLNLWDLGAYTNRMNGIFARVSHVFHVWPLPIRTFVFFSWILRNVDVTVATHRPHFASLDGFLSIKLRTHTYGIRLLSYHMLMSMMCAYICDDADDSFIRQD